MPQNRILLVLIAVVFGHKIRDGRVVELLSMIGSDTVATNNMVVILQAGVNFGGVKNSGSGRASSSCGELDTVNIKSTGFYYQLVISQSRE
jgi:hypothetical protein